MALHWKTTRFLIDLRRPQVMGIVNVTPDSFADGGKHDRVDLAIEHCDRLVGEGADILDIGGESTRPGSMGPGTELELSRVMPVIRHALSLGVPVSVDTSDPAVMHAALELGADIINDVRALRRPGAIEVLAAHTSAGICLMHMRGEPMDMAQHVHYKELIADMLVELRERITEVTRAGVDRSRIVLDPGYGFAKTAEQSFQLLSRQGELAVLGYPLLVGWSRKSPLGKVTGRPVDQRLSASLAAALAAVHRGASVLRVHDVAATVDALKVWQAAQTGQIKTA